MALVDITNSTVENNVDINTTEKTQTIDVIQEPDQTIGIEGVESNQDVLVVQEENQQDIKVDLPTGGVGLRGYSAYEIAVQNGFKGTEQEWLKSLEGEDGSTPYIQNGYWYIDGVNTTIKAEGKDGVSVSITKTSSVVVSGEKRTTVEFSDGTSITIRDGKNGADGTDGTSVTIISISESPDDDGKNIIVFSDGSTLSIKNGKRGDKGDKGEGFSISKTYSSIAEMNSGFATDGVPINGFVLINTGNIQDEDNAKLFVKLETGYSYLIDLSGAQGIKGDKGDPGDKGDTYTLNSDDINNIAQEAAKKIDIASLQRKEDTTLETNHKEVSRAVNELLHNMTGGSTWVLNDNLNSVFVAEFDFTVTQSTGNIASFNKMEGYVDSTGNYIVKYISSDNRSVPVYNEGKGGWVYDQHQTIVTKDIPDVVKNIATLQEYDINEQLKTKEKSIFGAINELADFDSNSEEKFDKLKEIELNTVGRCWVLQDFFDGNEDFDIDVNFVSNGTAFTQIHFVYVEDNDGYTHSLMYYDKVRAVYKIVFELTNNGYGWTDTAYQTIFVDDIDVDLSDIATERPTNLEERLPTDSKTLAGAIIEVNDSANEKINKVNKRIDEAHNDFNSNVEQTTIGQWITNFVGSAANFITALIDEIKRAIKTEEIDELESTDEATARSSKTVVGAVQKVNRRTTAIENGTKKVGASSAADKLAQARKITFTGGVRGEISFDGSEDKTVEITVLKADDKGTVYHIPAGWKAPSGYGAFLVNYKATVGDTTYSDMTIFSVGYDVEQTSSVGGFQSVTVSEDSIVLSDVTLKRTVISPSQAFTLEITGGTGATNSDLISWLEQYSDSDSEESKAIIDVVELPTENIDENSFYRVLTAKWVNWGDVYNAFTCHCVETLPEVGEPATTDMVNITAYYNASDGVVYGYVNDALGGYFGIPIGWYPAEMLFETVGWLYGGVITDIKDSEWDGAFKVLLGYTLYTCKDGKWESLKSVGMAGTGVEAVIFNARYNEATGDYSVAMGKGTKANGYNSVAEGDCVWASGRDQHAQGRYNIEDTEDKYAHIVGNGEDGASSNAHTIDWQGNGWFAGDIKVGGKSQDDKDAKKVLTEDAPTVDKVKSIDTWYEGVSELTTDDGICWREGFAFYSGYELEDEEISNGNIYHRIPIVAGNGIEFGVDEDAQVVKINATGGGSTPDNVILKYTVELTGSEMVTDIINQLRGRGYQLGTFGFVEFSGATSGLYGLTINHYGGNIYNIGGIDFGTFYTMANNVTDWSTVSLWSFSGYFQPPIPYCDDSNNGQVLKVVNGVPTWTNL